MAIGSKLGKVFGAIGSGLSFIPGPWSALGAVVGAAGGIAGAVGAKKEAQEQQQEPEAAQTSQVVQPADASRPRNEQLPTTQQPQPGPVSAKVFNQPQGLQSDYQSQMQSAIANLILKGDLNDLGGP
jgi:hypothetical protein